MEDRHLPSSSSSQTAVVVDVAGAEVVEASPGDAGEHDIYLPKHTEWISHIAIDIGGSLIKVVYFTRASPTPRREPTPDPATPDGSDSESRSGHYRKPNGYLTPKSLSKAASAHDTTALPSPFPASSSPIRSTPSGLRRRTSLSSSALPGGRLNFIKFETDAIDDCISFIDSLIVSSSHSHNVHDDVMRKGVKIMATGGGAHLYHDRLKKDLRVEVLREEEMSCLITGLQFITEIPHEVFYYSDDLVFQVSHPHRKQSTVPNSNQELERPSPNPPQYSVLYESPSQKLPCLLVNIGSGVSIIKIDADGHYERVSGTSLGGGTLWGLLSLITGASSFDEMLELSEDGNNGNVDMLVGDIYGSDYSKIGLKSSTIASSFGKVFRKGEVRKDFKSQDIAKSLLYAVSNNIGQIAYMNAEKHNINRIYFSGCFIRGHAATISTLSYAIRFWSKGTKRALFLRHEGYLGSMGAWLKNIDEEYRADTDTA